MNPILELRERAGGRRRPGAGGVLRGPGLLALVLAAACNDGDRGDAVQATREFLDAQDSAWCERMVRCGDIGASEQARCVAMRRYYRPQFPSLVEETAAGRIDLDADAAAHCLDMLRRGPCTLAFGGGIDLGCDFPFLPRVERNGACTDGRQCRVGKCEKPQQHVVNPGCLGTCKLTGSCAGANPPDAGGVLYKMCTSDLACGAHAGCRSAPGSAGSGPSFCQPVAEFDEACSGILPCRSGLACGRPGDAMPTCLCPEDSHPITPPMMTATPLAERGEPCLVAMCADGLYCSLEGPPVCLDGGPVGADCTQAGCASGLTCTRSFTGVDRRLTCQPFLDGGSVCDPDERRGPGFLTSRCPNDMTCDVRVLTCVSFSTTIEGESCTVICGDGSCGDACGDGLYCRPGDATPFLDAARDGGRGDDRFTATGTCTHLLALGEPCSRPGPARNPCFEGSCDSVTRICTPSSCSE